MENNFLNTITEFDTKLLIFLNNLGSENWDSFWLFITKQLNWIPMFVVILGLFFYKLGVKKTVFTLLFLVALIALSDQLTNLVKHLTNRTRPCNVAEIQQYLRQFDYRPRGNSFWSGHAFVSTTFTVFTIQLLKKHTKLIFLLILFPLIFGYSRLYLRVHYPIDVTTGYIMGMLFGMLSYFFYNKLSNKVFEI